MTTQTSGARDRSAARLPAPSRHGGSALGTWLRLTGWFVLVGLAAVGSGIVFAESGPASELAVWTSLTIVSVVCWLGLRRSARQSSRRRWHPSSFEIAAIAAVIAFGAGLWLRGSPTSATLVAVATLILAAFSEEFIFRWVPFDLVRRFGGRIRGHVLVSLISAVLFLSLHEMTHPALTMDRFLFSLMSYWLCVYSGSIWISWAAHVLTNGIAIVLLGTSPPANWYWLFLGTSTLAVAAVLLAIRRIATRRAGSGRMMGERQ